MSVLAKITELNPKHNVLATAQVKIDGFGTIKGLQLLRNLNTGEYRIIFPIPEGRKTPCIEISDVNLREKILDAVVAKYESRNRKRDFLDTEANRKNLEQERTATKKRRDYKKELLRFYRGS
jgi:DNA-binding cell septation regulator SpoVG